MKIIGSYTNGNTLTTIYDDGTKTRTTQDEDFDFSFAENIDIKVCNYCDANCPYCHEGSSINGKFGDILNEKFIDTLHPYQEIAIGGGDATSHPDLIPFLEKLKKQKVIANMTVNQIHFEQKQDLIRELVDKQLIYGIGVSLVKATNNFISLVKQYKNAVIHVINGIVTKEEMKKLSDNGLKVLILGYKDLRRGTEFKGSHNDIIANNQKWLYDNIDNLGFEIVSFDNLAIDQLNMRRFFTQKQWDEVYMGEEGTSTFYIDLVQRQFAESSTAPLNKRYELLDSVDDMFSIIKENNSKIKVNN